MSDEKPPSSLWGLAANIVQDKILRTNAKVHIVTWHGDAENVLVMGLNIEGRRVTKYTKFKRLVNFRPVWLAPNIVDKIPVAMATKEAAQDLANVLTARWGNVRFFDSTGQTLLRAGKPQSKAFGEESKCQ